MNNSATMQKEWNARARSNAYHWVMSNEDAWDKDEYYKGGVENITQYVLPLFEQKGITEEIAKTFHTVDIGCGTGRLCRAFSHICGTVTGIDISEEMLSRAKADNSDKANITFVQGSGADLEPITSESTDFCFSFIVFQHIPSKPVIRSYFEEVLRILKPGARAKIQVRGVPGNPPGRVLWFTGFDSWYFLIALWRGILPIPWVRKYNTVYGACFKKKELEHLLQTIGFTDVKVEYEDDRYLWAEIQKPE